MNRSSPINYAARASRRDPEKTYRRESLAMGTRIDGLTKKVCETFPSVKIYINMTITYPDHRVRGRSAKGIPLDAESPAEGGPRKKNRRTGAP
jgi:hypothetical protein